MYKLFRKKSTIEVEVGKELIDFRGDYFILTGTTPPHKQGSTGHVLVRNSSDPVGIPSWKCQMYYPGVFDCEFRKIPD